jgi:phosphate starvation-inducible PhoH-like protein
MKHLLFLLASVVHSYVPRTHAYMPQVRPIVTIPRYSSFGLYSTPTRVSNIKSFIAMRSKQTKSSSSVKYTTPKYLPRTLNQCHYSEMLSNDIVRIVIGVGPAGCGKTLFACNAAIQELKEGTIKRIVLTRPMVSVEEEEMGFLPGDMNSKMAPWTRPIFDTFMEYFSKAEIEHMLSSGVIEVSPLAFMRGRTFKHAFIIADEMQNSTPNQMLMLTTRIGEGSKMAITGDLKQSDRDVENGLLDIMNKLDHYEDDDIQVVHLTSDDIERSTIVTKIVELYATKKKSS